ncbi:MAG: hypothetical protein ABIA91_03260 [Patescibacteria group bacterium]
MTHSQINLIKIRGFLLLIFLLILVTGCIKKHNTKDCELPCFLASKENLVLWEAVEDRELLFCKCYYATGEYNSIKIINALQYTENEVKLRSSSQD